MSEHLLDVQNLRVSFDTYAGEVQAVRGVSFYIDKGETLAIVGESGCGKSVSIQTVMGLLPMPPARIKEGHIYYEGKDLTTLTDKQMENYRGKEFSMIFQDPMTSLNPVLSIGAQIAEAVQLHSGKISKAEVEQEVERVLRMVGIPPERKREYPHQFSGGMKQRVVIAMALVCNPALLIADEPTTALDVTIQAQVLAMMDELKRKLGTADEPTTALDVTIQAQILTLMKNLEEQLGTSMIFITHDLGIVAQTCERVAVMYSGEIIEYGTVGQIFEGAVHHPYTVGLFGSIPDLERKTRRLSPIMGLMPNPYELPQGCKFHPRCPHCMQQCIDSIPPLREQDGHMIRCHCPVPLEKEGV